MPYRDIDRRQILTCCGGSLLAFGLEPLVAVNPANAQPAMPAIDTHCHIFNASDLPVRGFVRRVVFEDYEETVSPGAMAVPRPFAGLIATLVGLMSRNVVSASQELEVLRNGAAGLAAEFNPYSPAAVEDLQNILDGILDDAPGQLSAISQLEREQYQAQIEAELRASAGVSDPNALLLPMANLLLASGGLIGRHIRWAMLLRSPRMTIAKELNALYGGERRVGLFTPALIDYSKWLDEEPQSDLHSQILVMEAVQETAIREHDFMIHCLAPFDPWRQALDVENSVSPTALDLVKEAVEQRGFLGVKLYPPMGFLPGENATGNLLYPEGADELPGFKGKIDAALDSLYEWAEASQVAILAHAARSNGAGVDFAERANPKGWRDVLRRFPELRLSLAHLGDFDSETDDVVWEDEMGALFEEFEHVFADLSYMTNALGVGGERRNAAISKLKAFFQSHGPASQRLMFGSDWIMFGREPDHGRYFEAIRSLLVEVGMGEADLNRIFGGNAVRYYGLAPGEAARGRLEAWYASAGLERDPLLRFG